MIEPAVTDEVDCYPFILAWAAWCYIKKEENILYLLWICLYKSNIFFQEFLNFAELTCSHG